MEENASRRFSYILAEMDSLYHEAALRIGLSDGVMIVLYTLDSHDGCLIGNLASLSGLPKQTLNSVLRSLERSGDIYLEAAGGKCKRVWLTEAGRARCCATVRRLENAENRVFASWEDTELEKYLELIRKYIGALREEIKEI